MRLIDAAPMLEQLDLEHYDKDWYVSQYNADWISSWLESQPVIEAEPVKHGRWVHDINNLYGCSECLERETMSHKKIKNYCPNCGAKMVLEEST